MTSINSLIIFSSFFICLAKTYEINGFCGRPERPYKSRLIPDKDLYGEGEEVSYQCDQYWNHLQKKKCVRGQWTGMQFRCGKDLDCAWYFFTTQREEYIISPCPRPHPQP